MSPALHASEECTALRPLAAYSVDVRTGFVPAIDPLERLPAAFDPWEALVPELSALIRARRIRAALADLPALDVGEHGSVRESERALLLLTVFANAWVWGGDAPDLRIPPQLAVPLWAVARSLDRPPIVHYASMALNNWRRVDSRTPVAADNARMQVQFLGGVDEDWFFIASLGVEIAGAPVLRAAHALACAAHHEDPTLIRMLEDLASGMDPVLRALERMREWCDPHVFYHRVRPYITGWPDPGVVYAGVSEAALKYVGGSAGQSSLIQSLDALLGIEHEGAVTGSYLRHVRRYMPVPHRRFVEDLEQHSRVRARAQSGSGRLLTAYNGAVSQVDLFRRRHMALARDYISKPSGVAEGGKGTGGTSFVDFLQDAQLETQRSRL